MVRQVVLNNDAHRRLRVITSRGGEFGENVHVVPVIANELTSLVLDYPVCMMKDPDTGRFGLSALLGFEPGENLYLEGDRWNASYVPLHVRRQPFMVSFSKDQSGKKIPESAVISIDLDSERVQESHGEALFNEDGSNTAYLDGIHDLLSGLMAGIESTHAFMEVLSAHDLIEAAQVNITFADGEQKRYEGIYTVNDEKLSELSGDDLEQMHRRGYLRASSLLLASLGHIQKLIGLRNAQHATR